MNSTTTTQAQTFATKYAADMAVQMLRTIKLVRWAATIIMVIAMLVSYTHQAGYLSDIGTPMLGAWLIPGAVDALTFLCVKVLGTPGMAQPAKTMALRVLVFPVLASGAINFIGPGLLVTKLVFVLAVLMIPAAELVASRIKPDFTAMDTLERQTAPAAPADEQPRKLDPEVAAQRAAKARATRERNRLAKLTPAQRAAATRARNAAMPVSPAPAAGPVRDLTEAEDLALASV
jgi:hypothetical protein